MTMSTKPSVAVIAGATGQDGHFLVERLLNEGWTVHADAHRPEPDLGANHGDYTLGTGKAHAAWQLAARAFTFARFDLVWDPDGDDPAQMRPRFRSTAEPPVQVDPQLLRLTTHLAIWVGSSCIRKELGRSPRVAVDVFRGNMLVQGAAAHLAGESS